MKKLLKNIETLYTDKCAKVVSDARWRINDSSRCSGPSRTVNQHHHPQQVRTAFRQNSDDAKNPIDIALVIDHFALLRYLIKNTPANDVIIDYIG